MNTSDKTTINIFFTYVIIMCGVLTAASFYLEASSVKSLIYFIELLSYTMLGYMIVKVSEKK